MVVIFIIFTEITVYLVYYNWSLINNNNNNNNNDNYNYYYYIKFNNRKKNKNLMRTII